MVLDPKIENDEEMKIEQKNTYQALIIKDIPADVFTADVTRKEFEQLFAGYGEVRFTYLPGFQRAIANFLVGENALTARSVLHGKQFNDKTLKMFIKEEAKKLGEPFLQLPKAEKLFLISPPASPPVGWEQVHEEAPVINYELLSAVARLEIPGKPVELVSKTNNTPGIIVVGCEDVNYGSKEMKSMKALPRDELQTKRPPIK